MNLLTRTTVYYMLLTMMVFSAGGLITYHIFDRIVQEETDWFLSEEARIIQMQLADSTTDLKSLNNREQRVEWLGAATGEPRIVVRKDTLVEHIGIRKQIPFRLLSLTQDVESERYRITIFKSLIETDDVVDAAFDSTIYVFAILTVLMTVTSYLLSRWLFRPFYHTLEKIRHFRIKDNKELNLAHTSTKEFNTLNELMRQMTNRILGDYRNLKEFTENASHEMQTPLAVAKSKLELLLSMPNLNQEQAHLTESALRAIQKLSKLNQALTLLTRIENQEFSNLQAVNISDLLHKQLDDFQELMDLKEITLQVTTHPQATLYIDPILADILLTNLLKNAVQHNQRGGRVIVELKKEELIISNTGAPLKGRAEDMFERFRKNNQASDSLGLGLSIVRKICVKHHLAIRYEYQEGLHQMHLMLHPVQEEEMIDA